MAVSEAFYLLWADGLRGPEASLLCRRGDPCRLDEHERKHKLAPPIPLKPGDEWLPLSVLARLYPLPGSPEAVRAGKAVKAQAIAEDPSATPAERATAAKKAAELRGGNG